MKTKLRLFISSVAVCLAIYCIKSYVNTHLTSSFLNENIEILADSEWGGGHPGDGGNPRWYEYSRINYEYRTVTHPNLPYYQTLCEVCTCHGYGDLFCNGYIKY